MHVTEILKSKGSGVTTTRAEETLAATARLLTDKRIGAVVVTDVRGKVVGMISERDIVRGVAKHGGAALDMSVGDFMTTSVISCKPEDNLNDIMALMTMRRVRHLPVIVDDELKGIISIGDVVKNRLDEVQLEVNVLRDYVRGLG